MNNLFYIFQIVLGIILSVLILIQAKGTGLGSTFGGEMGFYRTKRGFEKILFYLTIVVASLFLISSAVGLVL
jgi:preprotein translocase subunit SecG